jgi:tryptophan synthase beta chain
MVRVSFDQKPYRKMIMQTYGAKCIASPSNETNIGKAILKKDPNNTGSLGIAISEAIEKAAQSETTKYSLGSVLNHVLMHQTVVGNESVIQMEMTGDYPDILIGCTGGGSNFAGLVFPFLGKKFREKKEVKVIACEQKVSMLMILETRAT